MQNCSTVINSSYPPNSSCQGYTIFLPHIPVPLSEPDSEHDFQGYETALCDSGNQNDYDSNSEVFDEYEVVSIDESDQLNSDIDTDSDVDSIILEIRVSDFEDSDESFFADESNSSSDSDTEASTEDERDHWSCLTCGIKNKPFMRYCLKCWELRKNWLPEPPKQHKKRKPRPKKGSKMNSSLNKLVVGKRKKMEIPVELERTNLASVAISTPCSSQDSGFNSQEFSSAEAVSDSLNLFQSATILRTDSLNSNASGASLSAPLSSQESGFCSQEFSSAEVVDNSISLLPSDKYSVSNNATLSTQGCSLIKLCRRKRKSTFEFDDKSSSLEVSFPVTKLRRLSESSENYTKMKKKLNKFINTSEGHRWLRSSLVAEVISNVSSESENEQSTSESNCVLCCARPKNASIIHGRTAHTGFCFPCASKLEKSKQKCPICRRKIQKITKNLNA